MADSAERNADIVVAVRGNITLTTATGLANATITSYDEYGNTNTDTKTRPANAWHGQQQRSTNSTTGLIQMGVRLYNSITGLFLQQDPVHGGNPNTYTHPVDPINGMDLSGKFDFGKAWDSVASALGMSTYDLNHLLVDVAAGAFTTFMVAGICGTTLLLGCVVAAGVAIQTFHAGVGHFIVDKKMNRNVTLQSTARWALHDATNGVKRGLKLKYVTPFMQRKFYRPLKKRWSALKYRYADKA